MTGISPSRAALIAAARACLGTPFRHQGRQPGVGLDCVGLLVHAARAAGLCDYDFTVYGRRPSGGLLEAHLAAAGLREIPVARARPGDVALFRFDGPAQHVGLLSERGMIHAHIAMRGVVEHRLDPSWRARMVACLAFPKV